MKLENKKKQKFENDTIKHTKKIIFDNVDQNKYFEKEYFTKLLIQICHYHYWYLYHHHIIESNLLCYNSFHQLVL